MKVYREIVIRPQPEISLYFLWEKVYQQIHLGLVEMKDSNGIVPIGIGFPEYDINAGKLGTKLRLFAQNEESLFKFNAEEWLKRLSDYVHLTQIREVPDTVIKYNRFTRQQPKTNKERLARRKSKRNNISFRQAMKELKGFEDKLVTTPFINMRSQSTGKRFRLFIQKQECATAEYQGFNTYGMSTISSVPVF